MSFKKVLVLFLIILFSKSIICQEWESVSSFPNVFTHHGVGFSYLDKGYVVTGGDTIIASKKFFEYNSLTDEWSQKDDFPGEQRSYAIGDFYNGKQYIGFGANYGSGSSEPLLNDLWSYDPQIDVWEQLASCPCTGRQHPSFNALNGKIYVGLGTDNTGDIGDFWEYDIENNSWSQKADFIGGERHHPYHFTLGEYVYVGFGHNHHEHHVKKDWYRYDPTTDSWLQLNDLPAEGRVAGTQLYHEGFGYALSGQGEDLTNGFHHSMEEGEFWRYNPNTDTWDQLTSHPSKSRYAPASFIIDGYAYLISGLYSEADGLQTSAMRIKLEEVSNTVTEELDINVRVSPNPASRFLSIFMGEKSISQADYIKISSINGDVILTQQNWKGELVDISMLGNGNYVLNMNIGGKEYKVVFTKIDS